LTPLVERSSTFQHGGVAGRGINRLASSTAALAAPQTSTLGGMLVTSARLSLGDPDTLVFVAAIAIGVPLTMWELWQLGRHTVVYALAILWAPSIVAIVADLIRGRTSKATLASFFAWLAVAAGYGIYAFVV
jgi:hypothetical protein